MQAYKKKEFCTGCTACMNICPHNAINMVADNQGFLYPVIDEELCSDCGVCQKICPLQNEYGINANYTQPKVFAVKHLEDNVRMNSSSGGMFTAISDYILNNNGVVYGAAFDEQFRVSHQKAENEEERNRFRGSKYVQSDLKEIFKDIMEELKKGRQVLFTGTPCQNAGLSAYLHKNYENLYLCDLVCHGVPSPLLWKEYVSFIENRTRSRLVSYSFRYKEIGWRGYNVYAKFKNEHSIVNTSDVLAYMDIFGRDLALRPSCYQCKFTNVNRPSDITIADYWGIEKSMADFDDNMGVSLVLVNSPKGMDLFQNTSRQINYRESNIKDCLQYNLQNPTKPSPKREQFWRDYCSKDFEYVLKKYTGYGVKGRIKRFVRKGLEIFGLWTFVKKIRS